MADWPDAPEHCRPVPEQFAQELSPPHSCSEDFHPDCLTARRVPFSWEHPGSVELENSECSAVRFAGSAQPDAHSEQACWLLLRRVVPGLVHDSQAGQVGRQRLLQLSFPDH